MFETLFVKIDKILVSSSFTFVSRTLFTMPRVRQNQNFNQLSDFERGRIIGMKEAGFSLREIANRVGRNVSTVSRCWSRWSEEGAHERRQGSGRPRSTTDREERHLRTLVVRDRFSTSRALGNVWVEALGRRLSMASVYRRIRSFGLRSYRPFLTLPLTPNHRARRLDWCNARVHWTQEWHRVVFSDESRFSLWAHDGRRRVRRFRGERRNLQLVVERHTALTRGVMVWGAICVGSRSPLVFIQGNLNAASYIANVLEPVAVPYLRGLRNPLFQQDNARPHTARVTREYLEDAHVHVIPWPARSPDLSPIEHVWDIIGKRLGNLPHPPDNVHDLRRCVQEAWNEIPQDDIDHLILSAPHRVNECINNRGGPTHY